LPVIITIGLFSSGCRKIEVLSISENDNIKLGTERIYDNNNQKSESSLSETALSENNYKNIKFADSWSDIRELKMLQLTTNNPFQTNETAMVSETGETSNAAETTETTIVTESTDTSVPEATQYAETTSTTEIVAETTTQTTIQSDETSATRQEQTSTAQVPVSSDYISRILDMINAARAERGIPPLSLNGNLNAIACNRSSDMIVRNYFSHTTPEGKNIYIILQENGIGYLAAGENIASSSPASSASAEAHFNIWISSSTHRDNIFNGNFSQIGIGFDSGSDLFISSLIFIG